MLLDQVIDADAHVIEPPDLWTSRMPSKWLDDAPRVEPGPDGRPWWRVADVVLHPVTMFAHGGWKEFYPSIPPTLEEADPASWDPVARLAKMDEYGLRAQVLYPNILAFEAFLLMEPTDPEFRLACIQASNDFFADFASADPERLLPIALLPFWDVDASVAEMERCRERGHRGVNFAMQLDRLGLPHGTDRHWDSVYSAAQDLDLSVNFHIGFSNRSREEWEGNRPDDEFRKPNNTAKRTALTWLGNANTIADLTMGGVCHRFPGVKFVSVESGFGYVPFLISGMDWMWKNARDSRTAAYADWLLPSEYFRRQVYCTYWFEQHTLKLLEEYQDNVMFETDFPHPTSLTPGPGCILDEIPLVVAHENLRAAGIPEDVQRKVLYDNAAKLYKVT